MASDAGDNPVSPAVGELIRAGVRAVLDAPPEWITELNDAVTHGAGMEEIADDDHLRAVALTINAGNLAHWAATMMSAPGARVPVNITDEARAFVRDLARRGLDARSLDSFRTAQNVAWRHWMAICFDLTDDPTLLRELLHVTSESIAVFIDDTVQAMAEEIDVVRAELAGDTHAERRAALALVLEGAPIAQPRAEAQLGYRLDGPHTALVLTADPGSGPEELEAVCTAVTEASGASRRLVVLAGTDESWVWLPIAEHLDVTGVDTGGVTIAVGGVGVGRDGFRRSHFQALEVRRTLARLGSSRRVARHADLRLVALVNDDLAAVDDYLAKTLGELRSAPDEILETVRVWFAAGCNVSRAAERLYTHRNTVIRRLARADALAPVPIADDAVHVAVALELLAWR